MRKSVFFILSALVLFACGKKADVPKIAAWDHYQDPYFKIGFVYPRGWQMITEGRRISIYSSPDMVNRFYDYTTPGKDGVRLVVFSQKMDTLQTLNQFVLGLKNDLSLSGFDILATEAKPLSGIPGSFVHYSGVIDKNNKLEAVQIAAIRDSMLYTVKYEAFNLSYAAYRMAFDSTLATLSIPEPKVAQKDVDPSIPSTEYASFENNLLKLSYPDNFNTFLPMFKAPTVFSLVIKGYRQDSFIRLDVIPAKGLAPEKVVEQNVKFFKEISRSETMIDGQKTVYINYSPMKDINSRVYFLVKNDHFYRIIMNYYAPMNKDYLPAFEKAVASIVAK